jgi:hypothetical protein
VSGGTAQQGQNKTDVASTSLSGQCEALCGADTDLPPAQELLTAQDVGVLVAVNWELFGWLDLGMAFGGPCAQQPHAVGCLEQL